MSVFVQVIGTLQARDIDDQLASFSFSLASQNSNFSIRDHGSKSFCAYLFLLLNFLACSKQKEQLGLLSALVAMQQKKMLGAVMMQKFDVILTSVLQCSKALSTPDLGLKCSLAYLKVKKKKNKLIKAGGQKHATKHNQKGFFIIKCLNFTLCNLNQKSNYLLMKCLKHSCSLFLYLS